MPALFNYTLTSKSVGYPMLTQPLVIMSVRTILSFINMNFKM